MNHGKCMNCWWFKENPMNDTGNCYMQNDSQGHNYKEVSRYGYCPDYTNRKGEKKTLEEWLKNKE